MSITALAHYSVRTCDLEASRRFYSEVLGLRVGPRPPFGFNGVWLYAGRDDGSFGIVHLIGEGAEGYLGDRPSGGRALDHIAFAAEDWPQLKERLQVQKVDYAEQIVPQLGLHQVFVTDPDGIVIELNYPHQAA
jgi:catechol 2,3-dioxygenase-like lactoylglutathione lyase family enzyme